MERCPKCGSHDIECEIQFKPYQGPNGEMFVDEVLAEHGIIDVIENEFGDTEQYRTCNDCGHEF